MLEKEYQYYTDHKDELDSKYNNKFIIIVNNDIIGIYDNQDMALKEALTKYEAGTFLIQKCSKNEDQVMRFHSRVSFAEL